MGYLHMPVNFPELTREQWEPLTSSWHLSTQSHVLTALWKSSCVFPL